MSDTSDGAGAFDYSAPVAGSTIWSLSGRVAAQTVQVASFIVLAHLVAPADFGIVAIAAIFVGFAQIFTDLGIGPAIVARASLDADFTSTATVANFLSGLVLFALVAPLGSPLADAFGHHELRWIIPVTSTTFVVSVSAVNLALLERRFRFRAIAAAETASALIGQSLAVVLAENHDPLMGLALGAPVSALALTVITGWLVRGWGFAFRLRTSALRDLVSYAGPLVGANSINYWGRNVDNLLIGKLFSASQLAYYSRAYQLMVTPVMQLTLAWGRVLQASYAHDINDHDRLARRHALSQGDVAYCGFMLTAIVVPTSAALTRVVFGSEWKSMGTLLAILSISIGAQVVTSANAALLRAAGATRLLLRLGLLNSGLLICVLAASTPFGVKAVAIAFSAAAFAGMPIVLLPVCRTFALPLRPIVRQIVLACRGPLVVAALLVGAELLARPDHPARVLLAQSGVILGVAPLVLLELRRRTTRLGA